MSEQHLINAIFEVIGPGRECSRDDIWNRLNEWNKKQDQKLKLMPDEVKAATDKMRDRGMLKWNTRAALPFFKRA